MRSCGADWSRVTAWSVSNRGPREKEPVASDQAVYYRGIQLVRYDLIRECLIALAVVVVIAVGLAGVLSSPDDPHRHRAIVHDLAPGDLGEGGSGPGHGVPAVYAGIDNQQSPREKAFSDALKKATKQSGLVRVPSAADGPLPVMMPHLLALGQSGALDGLLLRTNGFYQANFSKPSG